MTPCIHHPKLCDATRQAGENIHRCFLDPGHTGPHVCVCWYRWKDDTP